MGFSNLNSHDTIVSVLETQYSGDTILLVFPDGTSPALLSAMMAGIPFNQAHRLEYAPGEFRVNVTRDSTLRFMDSLLQQPQANDEHTPCDTFSKQIEAMPYHGASRKPISQHA